MKNSSGGFTLFEILISLSILGIISAIGVNYLNGYRQSSSLDLEVNKLVSNLRQAQNKAVAGQELSDWGIQIRNSASEGMDQYAVFKGSSYTLEGQTDLIYLSKIIDFNDPVSGANKDIVFDRITGANNLVAPATNTTIVLVAKNKTSLTKTITINSLGQINVQ